MRTKWKNRAEWDAHRARPNEIKTVTYEPKNNSGLPPEGKITFRTGDCPCSICGHEHQYECEMANCECCSELCT